MSKKNVRDLASDRSISRGFYRALALTSVMAVLALTAIWSCTPDVSQDPYPEIMEFDPSADPPRSPEPTAIVINQETGLIDFSVVGIDVPEDCLDQQMMSVAQCEFYQYLESLDGFPTVTPINAPSSAPLDLDTLTMPDNLLIADMGTSLAREEVAMSYDDESRLLTVMPLAGWDVDTTYVAAVRGYDNGVKTVDGKRVVASVIYLMLKSEDDLTCGASTPEDVPADCPFFGVLAEQLGEEEARVQIFALEQLRQGLALAWLLVETTHHMPREEVAIVWGFPTHTASVAELYPPLGMIPAVTTPGEIRVKVKGSVDPATVTYFALGHPGSVFLLNLTALDNDPPDLVNGLPTFDATLVGDEIVMTAADPLHDGDLYAILLTDDLTNDEGLPFVPSPIPVMLRSRGELVDATGNSTISSISSADASDLEAGRQRFALLLDNELFANLTGLTRENVIYIYAFVWPDPTNTD